jgi:hypothetical protein
VLDSAFREEASETLLPLDEMTDGREGTNQGQTQVDLPDEDRRVRPLRRCKAQRDGLLLAELFFNSSP